MRGSHFSSQNTISLASVLETNHTLIDLTLSQCHIDSDGACQLASALCTNDTLQILYLRENPIGVKGAASFAEMLKTNHTLIELAKMFVLLVALDIICSCSSQMVKATGSVMGALTLAEI